MLSITLPETLAGSLFFDEMTTLVQNGVKSLEVKVSRFEDYQVIIGSNRLDPIYLNDLFSYISRKQLAIQVVLNFMEPHLEALSFELVKKWQLNRQVQYTGRIAPTYFSPRDRQAVHYDVTNCLPNYYQLPEIKRAHFDVIHYFLRKNKLTTLRLHEKGLTDDLLFWVEEQELTLSIYGVDSIEKAEELFQKGIFCVSISALDLPSVSFQKVKG